MAIDKNLKELAGTILKKQGIDHDTWLTEKYKELILSSSTLLKEGLELKIELEK